ncbi:mechanosensitive ion channel domain-containing protein, partial [Selenomonas sp.]|uniref:mechanosensitive ion channel family protein n=1 Tax=Selenomonas sp. TaxID=2053611 RepID=UPI0025CF4D52
EMNGQEFTYEYYEPTDALGSDKAHPKSHIAYGYATNVAVLDPEGRVTDITWRFTTIVPVGEGNMVVIPNQKIASSIITNYSMPRHDIIIKIPVGVAYDSDLQKVEDVTLEVAHQVLESLGEKIDDNRKPSVRFYNFGESSIDFNVLLHSARFDDQFRLKHEFIKALTARFRQEGIEIPFPIRTIVKQ